MNWVATFVSVKRAWRRPVIRPWRTNLPGTDVDGRWVMRPGGWHRERYAYYEPRRGYGDRDRDGIPNRYDRDRDNDGVPNRYDERPNNPNRY